MQPFMFRNPDPRRRGGSAVFVAISLVTLLACASLTIDTGMLYSTRTELQRTADAAALAGTLRLMDNARLKDSSQLTQVISASRDVVSEYSGRNAVNNESPIVTSGDVSVGYLKDPNSRTEEMDTSDPTRFNAIRVLVRRDDVANGPVDLFFAKLFGKTSSEVTASAAAAFMDGVVGFRPTSGTGNAGILPLALKDTAWRDLLNGTHTTGDVYSYDPESGTVSGGQDGIEELNLYPGSGGTQLPPGNFGTVNIGPSNGNSTAHLSSQIRFGVTEADLAPYGGELKLGPDGTLDLNGDTGLSAGIKDDLTAIIGQPRVIPIFSTVAGPGNNAQFTIVGFAGIRILGVKLTGSMNSKYVIIQPALVVDDSAITDEADGSSYFVYQPVRLVQ